MTTVKHRLSAEDWLLAGFRALVSHGPAGLKAEPLARELGATKGSFYWHFADVPAFHAEILRYWEARAFDDVVAAVESEGGPAERLYRLGELASADHPSYGGAGTEPAIRAWARTDKAVDAAMQRIDRKRLDYLGGLLAELGLTNPDFARLIYGAYIGMQVISAVDNADNRAPMSTLIAALLALRDA